MKKPKIKPEVVWMPWHEDNGFILDLAASQRDWCAMDLSNDHGETWPQLRKKGWRIVKVRISEVK